MSDAIAIEANVATSAAVTELEHVLGIVVDSPESKRLALENLMQLSAKHRELDSRRRELTRPLDDSKKRIMALFRPAIDKIEFAIERLKRQLGSYEQRVLAERDAAMKTATAALAAGDSAGAEAAIAAAFARDDGHVDGAHNRTKWQYEIVDVNALPRELMEPNHSAIGALVRDQKGATSIPGVRVWSEIVPVVRTAGGAQ